MWCLRCFEPVRLLSPREQPVPTVQFLVPKEEPERSRWKAGANTFGPGGRIAITGLVLAFTPWTTNLVAVAVIWPCYLALAILVLRATWRKDVVQRTTIEEMAAVGSRASPPPEAPHGVPRSTLVAWVALTAFGVGIAVVWLTSGALGHGIIAVCGSIAMLVLVVRWLARS